MLGCENSAAILIRQDGGFHGADFPGNGYDLLFIHTHKRHKDRHIHNSTGDCHSLHGLTCNLTQIFTGNQGSAAILTGNFLGNLHHKPAHNQGEEFFRTVIPDCLLNGGKIHDIQGHSAAVTGDQSCKLNDLILGKLGGIGIGEEMNAFNLQTSLCHHIGRNGRINTAGKQTHSPAACACRQTAGTGLSRSVDIGCQITNFHIHGIGRMVDIHSAVGMSLCDSAADLLRDLDGSHRKCLIGAFGFYLKRCSTIQIVAQILLHSLIDAVHILFTRTAAAQAYQTKNAAASFPGAVHISLLVHRLYIDRRLHNIHIKIAVGLHPAANILTQFVFKLTLVGALQDNLT